MTIVWASKGLGWGAGGKTCVTGPTRHAAHLHGGCSRAVPAQRACRGAIQGMHLATLFVATSLGDAMLPGSGSWLKVLLQVLLVEQSPGARCRRWGEGGGLTPHPPPPRARCRRCSRPTATAGSVGSSGAVSALQILLRFFLPDVLPAGCSFYSSGPPTPIQWASVNEMHCLGDALARFDANAAAFDANSGPCWRRCPYPCSSGASSSLWDRDSRATSVNRRSIGGLFDRPKKHFRDGIGALALLPFSPRFGLHPSLNRSLATRVYHSPADIHSEPCSPASYSLSCGSKAHSPFCAVRAASDPVSSREPAIATIAQWANASSPLRCNPLATAAAERPLFCLAT
jgi:hypothetical protein